MSATNKTGTELGTKLIILKGGDSIHDIKAVKVSEGQSISDAVITGELLSYEEIKATLQEENNTGILNDLVFMEEIEKLTEDSDGYMIDEDDEDDEDNEDDTSLIGFGTRLDSDNHIENIFALKFKVKEKYVNTLIAIEKFVNHEGYLGLRKDLTTAFIKSINIKTGQINTQQLKELMFGDRIKNISGCRFVEGELAQLSEDELKHIYKKFIMTAPEEVLDKGEYKYFLYDVDFDDKSTVEDLMQNNNNAITIEYILSSSHIQTNDIYTNIRGKIVYMIFEFPSYEISKHKNRAIQMSIGGLLGTLADSEQLMNVNLQAIWENKDLTYSKLFLLREESMCTVEKVIDGSNWGIKIVDLNEKCNNKNINALKVVPEDLIIWATDYSKTYNLDMEVVLSDLATDIYRSCKPVMNILKEQGLLSESEELVERFKLLLFSYKPISEYYYNTAGFFNSLHCLRQAEENVITDYIVEKCGKDNEIVQCLQNYVNNNLDMDDSDEARSEQIKNSIYKNITGLKENSIDDSSKIVNFKFKGSFTGAYINLIKSLKEELEQRNHEVKVFKVTEQ